MKICELFNLYAGGDLDKENYSKYQTTKYCFPIYSNSLTNKGLYGYTSRPRYKEDSITITGRGTIGVAEFRKDKFDAIIRLLVLEKKTNNLSQYITYYINHFIKFNVESTGVPQLTVPQIKNIEIKLPDLSVQKIVVEYLTNIEKYIKSLEKLIEKKKLIKQGVMQELLTGKKRLPGFNKEWSLESNIFKFVKGKQVSHQELDGFGKYKMYNGGISFSGLYPDYNYEDKIIISEGGNSCGFVNYIKTKFWAGGHCYVIISCDLDKEFLYQLLKFNQNKIMSLRVGSGLPNIQAKNLSKMNFYFPTSKQEQIEIGKILTDMDEEINSLEQDLEKYKQIKQGMMEQLLTGKIRLVKESDNVQKLPEKKHNQHFDDAVVFANIVASCYDPGYPLGRKKCQKMMYLFKRFNNSSVEQFGHYAAGPYDNKARYGGFETIAIKNKYVVENKSNKGSSFAPGPEIDKAKSYCLKYGYDKFIPIFNQYLKFKKVDELELYTTVDKTILELKEQNLPINVNTVKNYISNDKTWVPKLSREVFNDENIEEAICFSQLILGV